MFYCVNMNYLYFVFVSVLNKNEYFLYNFKDRVRLGFSNQYVLPDIEKVLSRKMKTVFPWNWDTEVCLWKGGRLKVLLIFLIFETNFYRSKSENNLKIQKQKQTVCNKEKFVVKVWEWTIAEK
jgi:hypothetical protein